jgi:hypothetical protein
VRSEAAFGHAIALGGFLSLGVPFAWYCFRNFRNKYFAIAIISAGVLATLSRGPLLALVLAVPLSIFFVTQSTLVRQRCVSLIAFVGGAALVSPYVLEVFDRAGAELRHATDYRVELLSVFLRDVNPIGVATGTVNSTAGEISYGAFNSLDSTFVFIAVRMGLLPLLVFCSILALCIIRIICRSNKVAEVAVVAQLPVLGTVALITQYGAFFWFTVGIVGSGTAIFRSGQDIARQSSISLPSRLFAASRVS